MGNCYLGEVDKIVARYAGDYIRFVDDYRIFGSSTGALEAALIQINRDLAELGLLTNIAKTKLGSGEDYLNATRGTKTAKTSDENGYISAVVLSDVPTPEVMAGLLNKVVRDPDAQLTEGMGRYIVGLLRRMLSNEVIARDSAYMSSPLAELRELLSEDGNFMDLFTSLLRSYANGDQDCRAIWLLYVKHACLSQIDNKRVQANVNEAAHAIAIASAVSATVKNWARGVCSSFTDDQLGALHDLDYARQGASCCGGRLA
ncbi:hypothetical protein GCM10009107_05150 [Ideonella azotifigens]|uniref:Reverse transcriptase domain-containing protein n=1 Tax=Ideonella azotifigens TaxID=513160 RepID=A0ABN1JL01_9BURK